MATESLTTDLSRTPRRAHDPQAAHDPRYGDAAASLRRLARMSTMVKVAMIARAVEDHGGSDLVSETISAKLWAICSELPPFPSATALLASIADAADAVAAKKNAFSFPCRAMPRMVSTSRLPAMAS